MSNSALAQEYNANGISKVVRWRSDAMPDIDAAIAADNSFALPRLVKGWMLQGASDGQYSPMINALLSEVEPLVSSSQQRESALLDALKLALAGQGLKSVSILEQWLQQEPTDLLVHQFAHEEIFWTGRSDRMQALVENAAPAWNETMEGYGSFLSLRAFANEEAGNFENAERFGRMSVEYDPADIWGAHAVAHVLLMKGETHSGIEWLEGLSSNWGNANQLRHHLWWHMCLFLIETGEHERIFELLTSEIRNPESPLVQASPAATIDITNYASLLMRLELYGVNVGEHWNTFAEICARRVNNHASAFSNIHDMMVLAATGQFDKAQELLRSMQDTFASQTGSLANGYVSAGIPTCEAVLAHRKGDYKLVLEKLGGVRHELSNVGASHAQRDVFYHMLVHASDKEGREDLREIYLKEIEQLGFSDVPGRAAYKSAAV